MMMTMPGSKPPRAVLFFLFIFCMTNPFKLSYCIRSDSIIFCPEIEQQALLSFKQSLEDPSNLFSSWNIGRGANCCNWKGVVCSNSTGHVHGLHLRSRDQFHGLRGKLNLSLLNLKHLRFLDLSQNNFGETIPSFIGSFTSLEYLNLSHAGFHGRIPHDVGNLSNLHTLSLETEYGEYYESPMDVDSLEWLSGLSQLEHLNMNNVNLSKATNWVQVINTLPSLVELHFHDCNLEFIAPLGLANITSLAILDLSRNTFPSSVFLGWIFQLSKLIFLDLSRNYFRGSIPATSNTTKLQYIDISFNYVNSSIPEWLYLCKDLKFVSFWYSSLKNTISSAISNLTSLHTLDLHDNELSGRIPSEISNLCKIRELDLSANKLEGEISNSFGNMSNCFLWGLKSLKLGVNQLSGQIIDQFGEFKGLQTLNLQINSLSGAIPPSLGKLSSLIELRLLDNKLTGNVPESVGQLFNLESLSIGYNKLEGVVTESHFANLTKLKYLFASGSNLTLKVSPNWVPPFKIVILELGSWNLGTGSPIPSWLETQKSVRGLDLSSTGISGIVPTWFWEIPELNLSHNHLHGKIPYISGPKDGSHLMSLSSMYLSSNQFSGSLPRVANTIMELDLSGNSFSGGMAHFLCDTTSETYQLRILLLGGNQLTGEIPDCWMKWPSLTVLDLGNNMMSGTIPNSIGFLRDLLSLNLHGNRFSGQLPFSMRNCTQLVKISLGRNCLVGNIPTWMGTSLANLRYLILRSNKLSGRIPLSICRINTLQIVDLSDNVLFGIIPRCVNNFTAMTTKRSLAEYGDYSYHYKGFVLDSASITTKGSELHYDTNILSLITNIDLSNNNLSGDIPKELTSLVELRSLNFSKNHLTGSIPDNIGDMKQLESLDLSRNSLLGEIPNSFTVMSSLNYLNLSYNYLMGRIPKCTQLMGMNASSFVGNNLCGPPLTSNCSGDGDEAHGPLHKQDNRGTKSEIDWFYVFLSLGYAVGFSVVCTTLVLKKSWREAYFGLLELMWNKLYVYSNIKWARLTKVREA